MKRKEALKILREYLKNNEIPKEDTLVYSVMLDGFNFRYYTFKELIKKAYRLKDKK